MIPEQEPLVPGMRVRHDQGLLCEVEGTRRSSTGYEDSGQLGGLVVNYTQLERDDFPAGTAWSKDETEFRAHFTPEGVNYNRDLVSAVLEKDTGKTRIAVTPEDIRRFAELEDKSIVSVAAAFNGVVRGLRAIERADLTMVTVNRRTTWGIPIESLADAVKLTEDDAFKYVEKFGDKLKMEFLEFARAVLNPANEE